MANFGELVLVLGDLHIPERANAIPENFKKMLVPNKMQHVICTGNAGPEQWNELRALAPNAVAVRGDMDTTTSSSSSLDASSSLSNFPEVRVVVAGQFRIGVIHGHQLLPSASSQDARARLRRKLDVDILVTGHTHQNDVVVEDGYYYINPGSITGAYSAMTPDASPSFILLAVQGAKLVCYVYEMSKDGEVEVSKTEFTKPVPAAAPAAPPAGANNPDLLQSLLA
eukprot:jgi/Psemu1/199144/e_gw1.232.82.1